MVLRFAKEIREEIAKTCGWDFPVAMRFSLKSMIKDFREGALPGEEFEEKGRDIEEGIEAAKLLEKFGYDALDVDAGTYDAWWWNHPPMYMEKAPYKEFARVLAERGHEPVLFEANDRLGGNLIPGGAPSFNMPLARNPQPVNEV